jgi:excisionase family DNA binding protein
MLQRRWLTVREVAELLRAHPKTIFAWVSSGKLPAARIGNRFVRIDGKALEAELERQVLSANSRVKNSKR